MHYQHVVFHATYTRLAFRPVHDFSYLSDESRRAASHEVRQLLGENLGFETNSRFQHIDPERYITRVLDARRWYIVGVAALSAQASVERSSHRNRSTTSWSPASTSKPRS